MFLNVKRGNDQLIALHDRLYTGLLAPYRSLRHTFVPRMTVGRLVDPAAFAAALDAAPALTRTFTLTVEEITLYSIDGASRSVAGTVAL